MAADFRRPSGETDLPRGFEMRKLATRFAWVAALSAVACNDPLTVPNRNNPDFSRAFATPGDIEQLITGLYQQIHTGVHGSSTSLTPQMEALALQTYGTVNNFAMGPRTAIPRSAIDNNRNNISDGENLRDFSHMSRRSRDASDALKALDALLADGKSLGTRGADNTGLNNRARAFALFANGIALGYLALGYDSAAIVTHLTPDAGEETPPLSGYPEVMAAAIALLDSAEGIAASAAAASGFPLPTTYISTPAALTQDQFVRVIRSFRARLRAGVARNPTERAAVNWTEVLDDATNGIAADFRIQLTTGWGCAFDCGQIFQDDSRGWHQMALMYYGMADTSGYYQSYIATPLEQRDGQATNALIKTPDLRWPSGETRAAQQTASPNSIFTGFAFPYIRNRSGQDTPSAAKWAHSFYDFYRWKKIHLDGGIGPWAEITKAEMDMLAAEAHLRANNFGAAATLIDTWRTRAGLQPVGVADATSPVQGGASNCVPRVPVGPNFNTTACGTIWEAMKYEKRMETAFTGYGQWYFDGRGWGDLPEGTALHWPTPNQELDARLKPLYNLGGVGGRDAAAKGTYGF